MSPSARRAINTASWDLSLVIAEIQLLGLVKNICPYTTSICLGSSKNKFKKDHRLQRLFFVKYMDEQNSRVVIPAEKKTRRTGIAQQ
jgi:hypothetical protein